MEWLKKLAIKYFKDVAVNPLKQHDDEIEAMADNFVKEAERTLSARKDFRYADKQRKEDGCTEDHPVCS